MRMDEQIDGLVKLLDKSKAGRALLPSYLQSWAKMTLAKAKATPRMKEAALSLHEIADHFITRELPEALDKRIIALVSEMAGFESDAQSVRSTLSRKRKGMELREAVHAVVKTNPNLQWGDVHKRLENAVAIPNGRWLKLELKRKPEKWVPLLADNPQFEGAVELLPVSDSTFRYYVTSGRKIAANDGLNDGLLINFPQ